MVDSVTSRPSHAATIGGDRTSHGRAPVPSSARLAARLLSRRRARSGRRKKPRLIRSARSIGLVGKKSNGGYLSRVAMGLALADAVRHARGSKVQMNSASSTLLRSEALRRRQRSHPHAHHEREVEGKISCACLAISKQPHLLHGCGRRRRRPEMPPPVLPRQPRPQPTAASQLPSSSCRGARGARRGPMRRAWSSQPPEMRAMDG